MVIRKSKGSNSYLIFIVLFYFFMFKDWLEQSVLFIGYGDELIALLAIPIMISELKKNQFKIKVTRGGGSRYVIVFISAGLISSVGFQYQNFLKIALPDTFLCIKFWLALYVGKHLFSNMSLERFGKKIYRHIKLVTVFYLICLCADWIFEVFRANIRYGFRSTQLMFSHPTVLVACCMFLIMTLLAIKDYVIGWKKWIAILLFLMCTTLRSKAWGTVLAVIMICYFVFYRKKKIRLRTLLVFVPLVIAIAWEQIEYYFFGSIQVDSARYQLLVKSIEIAKDYFPLGTGFGTFASYYSGVEYSPLYSMYGLAGVYGLSINNTAFMSDSFWPMVIGQTGVIGFVAFALAIVMLFKEIQKIRGLSLSLYAAALSGLSYLLISSVAESAFVHPLAVPIAILLGYILSQRRNNKILT